MNKTDTYWAIKRRQRASKAAVEAPAKVVPAAEELSYRDLQAQAKELDIPANQTKDELAAAIEEAQAEE